MQPTSQQSDMRIEVNVQPHPLLAEKFFVDNPEAYSIELCPEDDQLKVYYDCKGNCYSVVLDRHETESLYFVLFNAAKSVGREAALNSQLEQEISVLKEQLALARQQQFGTSSEQQSNPAQDAPPDNCESF